MKPALIATSIILALLLITNSSEAAEYIIAEFETFSPTAYWDVSGYAIGFGSHWNYDESRPVRQGETIDRPKALEWLKRTNDENRSLISQAVNRSLTNNQRTALLSLIYNIGPDAFLSSTLLRKLNDGAPIADVADEFDRWIHAGGVVDQGLVERRRIEKSLFLS